MSHSTGEVGVVGSGSMGRGMALLYSEKGSTVHLFDVSKDAMKSVEKEAKEDKNVPEDKITTYADLKDFCSAFKKGESRLIILSLPHGSTVDKVLDQLEPHLAKGDIILDGGNEYWQATERRQERFKKTGVHYIGCGVSGGYQSSRHGPSMSPGGDYDAYKKIEPLLKEWAAKDADGNSAVEWVGPNGAGHYVKMVHNGIEQGQLSVLAEAHSLLHHIIGLSNDEISDLFKSWNKEGELRDNFLVDLGVLNTHFKEGDGVRNEAGLVDEIEDKVTQDVDNSEGTGVWTVEQSSLRHVAAPTISNAHYLRLISSDKGQRLKVVKLLDIPQPSKLEDLKDKDELIEKVRLATYGGFLASFVQGINLLARASADFEWNVPMDKCIKIWRAGCIIQSNHISDLLQPLFEKNRKIINVLTEESVAKELHKTYGALKSVVLLAVEQDAVIPAISASLEYIKSVGGKDLPTNFEEAQLDAFGEHKFDFKKEGKMEPEKGDHHVEWRPT